MRIAVSGAHRTGKTTLVDALAVRLPGYDVFEEPYHQLVDEGYVFAEMPGLEDFEAQLARSIDDIAGAGDRCLFDRCPCDLLAYLAVHDEAASFVADRWLPDVQRAMARLDLVVFVPIESPERVAVAEAEQPGLRQTVDDDLRAMILADAWSLGVAAMEVTGTPDERVRQVLEQTGLATAR
jgi:predicted ATPase